MKNRVIEISNDGSKLSKTRGFLVIASDKGESRVPLDDIGVVLISSRGVLYTNSILVALAERSVPVVICDQRFMPVAWLWPMSGHHTQAKLMNAQLDASKPLSKRMWQQIVKAKIYQQAAVIDFLGHSARVFQNFAKSVRSGDPTNVEAQVARMYWPLLFGKDFRRRRSEGNVNVLLNYGYTVLRAAAARAVVVSGLHPSVGIHHTNQYNDWRLADDIVEPFRPLVDITVHKLVESGNLRLETETKRILAKTISRDVNTSAGITPISTCLIRLAQSIARSFLERKIQLNLPNKCTPLELRALSNE